MGSAVSGRGNCVVGRSFLYSHPGISIIAVRGAGAPSLNQGLTPAIFFRKGGSGRWG